MTFPPQGSRHNINPYHPQWHEVRTDSPHLGGFFQLRTFSHGHLDAETRVAVIKLVHQVDATRFEVIASANNLDVATFLEIGQNRTVAADGL